MIALPLGAIVWSSFFFLLFSLLACCFAVAVLLSNNIVRMAFYLVISLFSTAGLFFLAGAEFVGAMQIMIYVGGTLVLLIFGVMLTAQESFIRMKSGGGEWLLTLIVGASMLGLLVQTAFSVKSWQSAPQAVAISNPQETAQIGMALLGNRVDKESQPNEVKRNGMSSYLLPFEIVSVHLLVVLVGAAYLARPKRRVAGLAPAVTPIKSPAGSATGPKHHPLVLLVLSVGILAHLIGGAACFVFGDQLKEQIPPLAGAAPWLMPTLGVILLLDMLLLVVILQWQKWGFVGLAILAFAQAGLIYAAGAGIVPAAGLLVSAAIGLGVLYAVLQLGGPRSTWARLK